MLLLRASQIASFIENGTHDFPYRDPQSDRIVPPITLTDEELKTLGSLGELNKKVGLKGVCFKRNSGLGCCGDCEQWIFENWVMLIQELLGIGPTMHKSNVRGVEEFDRVMIGHGYSKTESDSLIRNLGIFLKKAATALGNKIPHKPYHFDENGFVKIV